MKTNWFGPLSLFPFLVPLVGASVLEAQSVYVLDMSVTTGEVFEYSFLGGGPCTSPGVQLSSFPTGTSFPGCSTAAPAMFPLGDIAVDSVLDQIWVTDGNVLTGYERDGTAIASLQILTGYLPNPFTGLGMDSNSAQPRIFATDGTDAVGFVPPGGCFFAGFGVAFPGAIPTPTGALVTDIDYDPKTDSLWACDVDGWVTNFDASNGTLLGTSFLTLPNAQGIAVDDSNGNLLVSDGTSVIAFDPAGTPASPTWHLPGPSGVPGGITTRGIAYAARALPYGNGSGPTIDTVGQTFAGNMNFAVLAGGTAPGASCILYYSSNPLCPSIPITASALPLNLVPPVFLVGTAPANAMGNALLNTPLPIVPCGQTVYLQWLTVGPTLEVSSSMGLTISEK